MYFHVIMTLCDSFRRTDHQLNLIVSNNCIHIHAHGHDTNIKIIDDISVMKWFLNSLSYMRTLIVIFSE